eukprot:TRINITY_DN3995_c0_g2_i4.p1 TRINITY_DN3995_c0_g2~~TRINITY_DN3995_c0_g2_i4.p1  ORF type:complete len:381 (+),score=61.42 TRINITY_DN3995_c0_g2_i4:115-1257(+)
MPAAPNLPQFSAPLPLPSLFAQQTQAVPMALDEDEDDGDNGNSNNGAIQRVVPRPLGPTLQSPALELKRCAVLKEMQRELFQRLSKSHAAGQQKTMQQQTPQIRDANYMLYTTNEWSENEKYGLYLALITHGVPKLPDGSFDWEALRMLSHAAKRVDDLYHFYVLFLKECKKTILLQKNDGLQASDLRYQQAAVVVNRLGLFHNIYEMLPGLVRAANQIDQALANQPFPPNFPRWWRVGEHDRALVQGVCTYGFGKWEDLCADPNLPFYNIAMNMRMAEAGVTDGTAAHLLWMTQENVSQAEWQDSVLESALHFSESSLTLLDPNRESKGSNRIILRWPSDDACFSRLDHILECFQSQQQQAQQQAQQTNQAPDVIVVYD